MLYSKKYKNKRLILKYKPENLEDVWINHEYRIRILKVERDIANIQLYRELLKLYPENNKYKFILNKLYDKYGIK